MARIQDITEQIVSEMTAYLANYGYVHTLVQEEHLANTFRTIIADILGRVEHGQPFERKE